MSCCQGPVQNKYVLLAPFKLHYLQCQWDRKQATLTHTSTILLGSSMHINAQRRPIKRLKCFCPSRVYRLPFTCCVSFIVFGKIKAIFLKYSTEYYCDLQVFPVNRGKRISRNIHEISSREIYKNDVCDCLLSRMVIIFFSSITSENIPPFLCGNITQGFHLKCTGHMTSLCHSRLRLNAKTCFYDTIAIHVFLNSSEKPPDEIFKTFKLIKMEVFPWPVFFSYCHSYLLP